MEEAKPRPAPAGISPRGCRLRDDRTTRPPNPRGSTVAQAETAYLNGHTLRPRESSVTALASAKRAAFHARRSQEPAPRKPQTRSRARGDQTSLLYWTAGRPAPAPAPAEINPNRHRISTGIRRSPAPAGINPSGRML